jgi:hypothetical protein
MVICISTSPSNNIRQNSHDQRPAKQRPDVF